MSWRTELVESLADLENKVKGEDSLQLCGVPEKGREFYLFRGAKRAYPLLSSIQRAAQDKWPERWKEEIGRFERRLLARFQRQIVPHESFSKLAQQYAWLNPTHEGKSVDPDGSVLRKDPFRMLSILQHFGCPTRLCDFTSDLWIALFFAVDGACEGDRPCVYRIKCKNENDDDEGGNKVPRYSEGRAWPRSGTPPNVGIQVSDMLSCLIHDTEPVSGLNEVDRKTAFRDSILDGAGMRLYGWDRPYFSNARLEKQRGWFVYPANLRQPLEEALGQDNRTECLRFDLHEKLVPNLRAELQKQGLERWKVYLDLNMALEEWRNPSAV